MQPKKIYSRSNAKSKQYWEPSEYPKELKKIKTIFQWNEYPNAFKESWVSYIETEFDRREDGFWFKNNGVPTYITGSHYMYLQWTKIDVGHPEYRESNRLFFIFWEACKSDAGWHVLSQEQTIRILFHVLIRNSQSSYNHLRC